LISRVTGADGIALEIDARSVAAADENALKTLIDICATQGGGGGFY
jgi:hypothetical protein